MANASRKVLYLASIIDMDNPTSDWVPSIVNYTVEMLNNKSDEWHDEVLDDGTYINCTYVKVNKCDQVEAVNAYWGIRTRLGNHPPHGIVGARCSDASIGLALISGVESVPQVSPDSTSAKLSNKEKFPFFSRLVAPDDARGQAGALVSLMQYMNWERLSIIYTDSQYSRDLATAFKSIWPERGIVSSSEVKMNKTAPGGVDAESTDQALRSVPVDNPATNSRIVLLIAHDEQAYEILRIAHRTGFQKDTVWIGTDGWTGPDRIPKEFNTANYGQGYLGVLPKSNQKSKDYSDYLKLLNAYRTRDGLPHLEKLPDYAAETLVDSILALTMAYSQVAPDDDNRRRDGALVSAILRNLTFHGVNGPVAFTSNGDRANPSFAVWNSRATGDNGTLKWVEVGHVGVGGGSTGDIRLPDVCFVHPFGCNLTTPPPDTYPVPPIPLPLWVSIVVPVIAALLLFVFFRYLRTKMKKNRLRQEFKDFESRMAKLSEEDRVQLLEERYKKPSNWTIVGDEGSVLVNVSPFDAEYWDVLARLQREMPDAYISTLWRVQNHPLWGYYTFHKDRFHMSGIADHNEVDVWHGTTNLDPDVIYRDRADGFMMQFARMGFWGRGLYFAEHSRYSDMYSYKPWGPSWQPTSTDRPIGEDGEREMFLAKLLVGNATDLEKDSTLVSPPHLDPSQMGLRFNTVRGVTDGSPIFIVYENGRAYPSYLVRYYKGVRDPRRTPYETFDEAAKDFTATAADTSRDVDDDDDDDENYDLDAESGSPAAGAAAAADDDARVTWQFMDNGGMWSDYLDDHQELLEAAYQRGDAGGVVLDTGSWTYQVDLTGMSQVNRDHPGHTRRQVRRLVVPADASVAL
jgi:ABC-type branched-subunit amino acid transport system substrate-binding protein